MKTKQINYTELNVGNVVHFHGARFEIYEAYMIADPLPDNSGPIMRAKGKWLDGATVNGYFGPNKDWIFQGNKRAICSVE